MTLAEFETWALKQGSVANPEPNNKYKGECVSLVQQYLYQVFGKSFKAYGNAKDWETNYPTDYFTKKSKSTTLQAGDVLVYGSNYGGGYGHVGIIDPELKFLEQNGVKSNAVGTRTTAPTGYVCVLRPINQDKLGLAPSYKVGTTYKTQVILKVRSGAGTNYSQISYSKLTTNAKANAYSSGTNAGCLKSGTKVTCQQIKNVGNDIWIKIPSGWVAGYYSSKVYVK